jgi:hypothetical protein
MKNAICWDVMLFASGKNQHFGGTYHLHHPGTGIGELGTMLALTGNQNALLSNTA